MTATPRQLAYIRSLATERSLPADEVVAKAETMTSKDVSTLIDRLKAIPADKKQASPENVARIDGLRTVVDRLDTRDRSFAIDLIASFDKRGDLSERQWPWVDTLTSRATVASTPVEPGLYRLSDGQVVKVYLNQNRRLSAKVLIVRGNGKGSFTYVRSAMDRVRAEGTPLTEAEAQAFGRQHGLCCACARYLDDERSLAVGYGPVCANHYGWHYPNYDEASKILNRPVSA